jgi:hypothetical protein
MPAPLRSTAVRVLTFVFALALVLIPRSALARTDEEPNYRYVEGGYLNINTDDLSKSGDNGFLGASWGWKHIHVLGYWAGGDAGPDVSQDYWRVGVGWHGLLGDKADVVGELYHVEQTIDPPGPSQTDTGYRVTGGVRWLPLKFLELDGFANYNDVTDKSDTSWEARAIFDIWRLGFGADYEKFDNADQWNGFVRFNFGRR